MDLRDYVKSFPRSERMLIRQRIASALHISEVFVRSMCNGQKKIPVKYAIRIERITNGAVSRHETAPHIYPIER